MAGNYGVLLSCIGFLLALPIDSQIRRAYKWGQEPYVQKITNPCRVPRDLNAGCANAGAAGHTSDEEAVTRAAEEGRCPVFRLVGAAKWVRPSQAVAFVRSFGSPADSGKQSAYAQWRGRYVDAARRR